MNEVREEAVGRGGLRGKSWIAGADGEETRVLTPTALSWGHLGRMAWRLRIGSVENTSLWSQAGKEALFTVGGLQASLQPGMTGGSA